MAKRMAVAGRISKVEEALVGVKGWYEPANMLKGRCRIVEKDLGGVQWSAWEEGAMVGAVRQASVVDVDRAGLRG